MARLAVNLAASIGMSKVVHDFIRNNVTVVTTADAVKVAAGSLVIGSMVAEHASKHVNSRIDSVIAWHENRKEDKPTTE
jgi:hypothetical protein